MFRNVYSLINIFIQILLMVMYKKKIVENFKIDGKLKLKLEYLNLEVE